MASKTTTKSKTRSQKLALSELSWDDFRPDWVNEQLERISSELEKWGDDILCSPLERKALGRLLELGLTDVFRLFDQPEKAFSWWDYRRAGFQRNAGLRIDLILASEALSKACSASYIDREPRAWERPSDHTPVVAEFDL